MPPPVAPQVIGRVAELWRYPVKSTAGERLDAVRVGARGVGGDRRWAVSLVEDPEGDHLDAAPVHLLSTASLAWLAGRRPADGIDGRRFRPNVLVEVDGGDRPEDDWVGRQLVVGGAVLSVDQRTKRCVMTTLAQGPLGFAPGVLRSLQDATGERLGVYASVVRPGTVRVGDPVALCDPAAGAPPPEDGPEGRAGRP